MDNFFLGFADEMVKVAKPDQLPTGTIAGAGAAYEGIPKALLGALIGSAVGGKGRRLKAALGGGGIGALIGAAKGAGMWGGLSSLANSEIKKMQKLNKDMLV